MTLPSIDKSDRYNDCWGRGPDIYVNPAHVIAVEPKQHSYHSFRPHQDYCTIHLSTGTSIDVMMDAASVSLFVDRVNNEVHRRLRFRDQ